MDSNSTGSLPKGIGAIPSDLDGNWSHFSQTCEKIGATLIFLPRLDFCQACHYPRERDWSIINQRQRRTCYALCLILYPVSAAHTSIFRMDSNSTDSLLKRIGAMPSDLGGNWSHFLRMCEKIRAIFMFVPELEHSQRFVQEWETFPQIRAGIESIPSDLCGNWNCFGLFSTGWCAVAWPASELQAGGPFEGSQLSPLTLFKAVYWLECSHMAAGTDSMPTALWVIQRWNRYLGLDVALERVLHRKPTGPKQVYHRDDLVDRPRAMGV